MQILKEKIVRYETDGSIVKGYDAGELIHCRDCKAYNGMKCVRNNMIAVREDDFCSRGEEIR